MKSEKITIIVLTTIGGCVGLYHASTILLGSASDGSIPRDNAVDAVPSQLMDQKVYRPESDNRDRLGRRFDGSFRHLENGRLISVRVTLNSDIGHIVMMYGGNIHRLPNQVLWALPSAIPPKNELPSGHEMGFYISSTLGLSREQVIEFQKAPFHSAVVYGPNEIFSLTGYGPLGNAPRLPNRVRHPEWIDDPQWPFFLEALMREGIAKAASRRLKVVGDLGRTDQGLRFVKLETAARFAGYSVKLEERGLKATLTKGGVTRVIWAGEPMVKGDVGDVVMLKEGVLWVPEFWESVK